MLDYCHLFDVDGHDILIQLVMVKVVASTVDDRRHAVDSLVAKSAVSGPRVPTHLVETAPCGVASEADDETCYGRE